MARMKSMKSDLVARFPDYSPHLMKEVLKQQFRKLSGI